MKYFSDEKITQLVADLESLKHTWPTDDSDAGYNSGIEDCIKELRNYFPEVAPAEERYDSKDWVAGTVINPGTLTITGDHITIENFEFGCAGNLVAAIMTVKNWANGRLQEKIDEVKKPLDNTVEQSNSWH